MFLVLWCLDPYECVLKPNIGKNRNSDHVVLVSVCLCVLDVCGRGLQSTYQVRLQGQCDVDGKVKRFVARNWKLPSKLGTADRRTRCHGRKG